MRPATRDPKPRAAGRIRAVVPADWEDRSTLVFVAPAHPPPIAPLSGKAGSSRQRNLTITLDRTGETTLEQYLARIAPDQKPEPIEIAGRSGACIERRTELPNGWIRQLVGVVMVETNLALVAAASIDEGSFRAYRSELIELLAKIEYTRAV